MTPDAFITLADGHALDLLQPASAAPSPYAIAHSLAQLNRFTGHALRPYSVAEHSMLVVDILQREHGITPSTLHGISVLLAGLLHDAHECITGDLHTPGKACVGPAWHAWEQRFEQHLRSQHALHTAFGLHGALIKAADLQALATERRDLLLPNPRPWACLEGVRPVDWLSLNTPERTAMGWEDWRDRWLDAWHELNAAREALA